MQLKNQFTQPGHNFLRCANDLYCLCHILYLSGYILFLFTKYLFSFMATEKRPKTKDSLVWWSSKEMQHSFSTELLFWIKETQLAWLTFHESCNNPNSLKEWGSWVYRFVLRNKYHFTYEMKNKRPNKK